MFYEISRRSIHISKNEETSLLWHNSVLTVRTEKGIELFDFSYNLQCLDKNIDFVVSFIPNPKSSAVAKLFPDRFLKNNRSNLDATQMVLDPGLWPHNKHLTQEMANIAAFEWSPVGFIHNNECGLALLSNIGNVEIFASQSCQWTSILDLSVIIKDQYLSSQTVISSPENLEQLKETVYAVESSCISWGPQLEDGSNYFVTGQRNGSILVWLLKSQGMVINVTLLGVFQTEIGESVSILWIPISQNKFLLICSNVLGQIYTLDCRIQKDCIENVNVTCLWMYKDRMIAKYLLHTIEEDKIMLLTNKHRHLLLITMNKDCKILSQVVKNVNDYRITNLTHTRHGLYLSTVNCKLYKIDLIDNMDFELSLIDMKDSYSTSELYSFCLSENNVIWALGLVDRKIKYRKDPDKIDIIFLSVDPDHQCAMSLLLNNSRKTLTNYFDCIEMLRYKTMKLKALPSIDFKKLYAEASDDLYKLKLYFILVILYNSLAKILKNGSKGLLPETSLENVREQILVSHASAVIKNLYSSCQSKVKLMNGFELETFIGAKKYLEYYCEKNKKDPNEFVASDVLNLTSSDVVYTCQCCEKNLTGLSCENGHLNMFCSLTFTAIERDDYLCCRRCNSVARIELYENKPMCVFCDLYMNNHFLTS